MDREMLERSIFIIRTRIEEEVKLLLNILTQFNDANQVFVLILLIHLQSEKI